MEDGLEEMTLIDGLVVIGIFIGFGFLIISHMRKKNPNLLEGIKTWFREKPELINKEETKEKMEQIYQGKRWGM